MKGGDGHGKFWRNAPGLAAMHAMWTRSPRFQKQTRFNVPF